jgi:hypothetical protein
VFGPPWAGRGPTLLARMATGSSGTVTLLAGLGRIGEDGELFRGADPLPEQLQLALHLIEATLGCRELGTKFLGLTP